MIIFLRLFYNYIIKKNLKNKDKDKNTFIHKIE